MHRPFHSHARGNLEQVDLKFYSVKLFEARDMHRSFWHFVSCFSTHQFNFNNVYSEHSKTVIY